MLSKHIQYSHQTMQNCSFWGCLDKCNRDCNRDYFQCNRNRLHCEFVYS